MVPEIRKRRLRSLSILIALNAFMAAISFAFKSLQDAHICAALGWSSATLWALSEYVRVLRNKKRGII